MACSCGASSTGGGFPGVPSPAEGADDDMFEWEIRDSSTPFWQHATAGSCAGIMEHIGMYPIDTVKTRIQASPVSAGVLETFRDVWRERGALGLMRGSMVIGVGCVPAHVALFGTYEFAKAGLLDSEGEEHQPVRAAACGAMATVAHDAIITPTETVKQRLQMGRYKGAVDCVLSMYRSEGVGSFYRSLPTTLAMNVPYMGLLVATNESLKRFLRLGSALRQDSSAGSALLSGAPWYFLSAGVSGAFAATLTLPLDVVKTRLQTQGGLEPSGRAPRYSGILSTIEVISQEEGMRGFFRGLGPRVALAIPSAAICWGTYETIRMLLAHAFVPPGAEDASDASPPAAGGGVAEPPSRRAEAAAEAPDGGAAAQPGRSLRRRPAGESPADAGATGATAGGSSSSSSSPPLVGGGGGGLRGGAAADCFEWEEWDRSTPFWKHAVAGSSAGMMEHVAMYPIDTVKTRMQAAPARPGELPLGVVQTFRIVIREHGFGGLMRGCFAIGAGCIPAHIGLFCTYEVAKARLMDADSAEHQPLRAAACGALATVVHDMIITPTDVVKQRLQLGCYRGTLDCAVSIWRREGLRAFYRSLPTTLVSECPFHGVLVASNESLKLLFGLEGGAPGSPGTEGISRSAVGWHFLTTGISGVVAAAVTQPLDVVKTRLQTQSITGAHTHEVSVTCEVRVRYSGMLSTALLIRREEGVAGLFRGTVPRLLFAAPSAAMCWGTYEVIKKLLSGSGH